MTVIKDDQKDQNLCFTQQKAHISAEAFVVLWSITVTHNRRGLKVFLLQTHKMNRMHEICNVKSVNVSKILSFF